MRAGVAIKGVPAEFGRRHAAARAKELPAARHATPPRVARAGTGTLFAIGAGILALTGAIVFQGSGAGPVRPDAETASVGLETHTAAVGSAPGGCLIAALTNSANATSLCAR